MAKKDIVFINGWPNSLRPLDSFLPELKQRAILVAHVNIAGGFQESGWECIAVKEHSWAEYQRAVVPLVSHMGIQHVVADSELHLQPAAYLRNVLGVPGQSIASANAYRNKIEMLGFVKGASTFRVPNYIDLGQSDPREIHDFCSGYEHIVIKPIEGTDSKGVQLLTAGQLSGELSKNLDGYFAQEYISYPVYHVDGLFVKGKIEFFSLCKYYNSCFEYSRGGIVGSDFVLDEVLREKFGAAVNEALTLMPTPLNTTFHAEFFYSDETGDLVFCEIASRTGGGCGAIVALIDSEYGVNLPREMIMANVEKNYLPKQYQRRSDGITAASLFIPKRAVKKSFSKSLGNLVYFLDSSRDENWESEHLSTDGAVKLVFSAHASELECRRQELIALLTND